MKRRFMAMILVLAMAVSIAPVVNVGTAKAEVTGFAEPTINMVSHTVGMGTITIYVSGYRGSYVDESGNTIYGEYFVMRNGALVDEKDLSVDYTYSGATLKCPVSYGQADEFQVIAAITPVTEENHVKYSEKFTAQSKQIEKLTGVGATKINAKKAVVSWYLVEGATGYKVYKNGKVYKTVGKKSSLTVSGSGAGSAKYKVQPLIKIDGKTYTGSTSKAVKPVKNATGFSTSTYYDDYPYQTCKFIVKKISLTGKTYTVTGYAVNNRMFTMKKYRKLTISIANDSKVVAKKTFKNVSVNVAKYKSKKLTFKIKGKAGADLAHGWTTASVSVQPEWA